MHIVVVLDMPVAPVALKALAAADDLMVSPDSLELLAALPADSSDSVAEPSSAANAVAFAEAMRTCSATPQSQNQYMAPRIVMRMNSILVSACKNQGPQAWTEPPLGAPRTGVHHRNCRYLLS